MVPYGGNSASLAAGSVFVVEQTGRIKNSWLGVPQNVARIVDPRVVMRGNRRECLRALGTNVTR
jgi:hypothetical protein